MNYTIVSRCTYIILQYNLNTVNILLISARDNKNYTGGTHMKLRKIGSTLLATAILTGTMTGMAFANTCNSPQQVKKPIASVAQAKNDLFPNKSNKQLVQKPVLHQEYLEKAANVLRMTVDQLRFELESGKKIEDIVAQHGMTMEQFNKKMQEIRKKEITDAVRDKKMTQAQANKNMKEMDQYFKNIAPKYN